MQDLVVEVPERLVDLRVGLVVDKVCVLSKEIHMQWKECNVCRAELVNCGRAAASCQEIWRDAGTWTFIRIGSNPHAQCTHVQEVGQSSIDVHGTSVQPALEGRGRQ